MRKCCQKICYLGPSYIADTLVGRCATCGSVRHGHKTNWKIIYDPELKAHYLVAKKAKGEKERKAVTPGPKNKKVKRQIELDFKQLEDLSGDKLIELLKAQGINVTSS